eukprot:5597047-Pleurochrysis_carterae.AAC.1
MQLPNHSCAQWSNQIGLRCQCVDQCLDTRESPPILLVVRTSQAAPAASVTCSDEAANASPQFRSGRRG